MPRVVIHGFSRSTWTQTAHMVCIEKGLEHELVPIAYGSDEHGQLHPYRRIPVVEVDGLVLFETLAIVCYLDEVVEQPRLQPDSIEDRARMRTWMGVCSDYLYREVVRGIPRDRASTEAELSAARLALERAEGLMAGEAFLVGAEISLADLYLAPVLANCAEKAPELLGGLPRLDAWSKRIRERESYRLTR
jgi:glutathione S-transferase